MKVSATARSKRVGEGVPICKFDVISVKGYELEYELGPYVLYVCQSAHQARKQVGVMARCCGNRVSRNGA